LRTQGALGIRKSGCQITGKGFAATGLITGYFSLVWIVVFALMVVVAIANSRKLHQSPSRTICVANLKMIEGAKGFWALGNRKPDSAVPQESDIFGPSKAIQTKPICPEGGIYTLNAVSDSPQCSVHGGLSQLGAGP
jgi:hypothetical protein